MAVIKSTHRLMNWSALSGALVWLALLPFAMGEAESMLIMRLMLMGVLVIVPLGLSLVAVVGERSCVLLRIAMYAQPVGALAVLISFLLPQGTAAALLASGWLVVTGLVARSGLVRLLSKDGMRIEEFAVNAGLGYVFVGGWWLVFSRYGLQPLDFGDTIVLLTAVHFHYAGFAAPILAGLAGRALDQSGAGVKRLFQLTVICVVSGMPLVAAGITFTTVLALLGAVVMAAGLWLLSALVCFRVVPRLKQRTAQALLIVSSASSVFAMALAALYAYSLVAKTVILDIPRMAELHGIANAFGFSLCGLLAWRLVNAEMRAVK